MFKYVIYFVFICTYTLSAQKPVALNFPVSQTLVKTEKKLNLNKTILVDSVVTKVDSLLFNKLETFTFFENNYLLNKYKFHVFGYKENKSIQQWIVPIKIYFDPLIEKTIIEEFKKYIVPYNNIKNLNISIVNNLDEANYYFKVLDKPVSAFSKEDSKDLSLEEKKSLTFSQMTYHLNVNTLEQFYSCTFKISASELNNDLFLSKLKKGFYLSLNRFYSSSKAEKFSILNNNTEKIYTISDYDLAMLQIHYSYIFKMPVFLKQFENLQEIYKTLKN